MTTIATLAIFSGYGTPVASASLAMSTHELKGRMVICHKKWLEEVGVCRSVRH